MAGFVSPGLHRAAGESEMLSLLKIAPACYVRAMNSAAALETLRRSESALRSRGVRRAALFGSVARGENRPDSDIDIMVEIDPEAHITIFDYVDIKDYIAGLFDGPAMSSAATTLSLMCGPPRRPMPSMPSKASDIH